MHGSCFTNAPQPPGWPLRRGKRGAQCGRNCGGQAQFPGEFIRRHTYHSVFYSTAFPTFQRLLALHTRLDTLPVTLLQRIPQADSYAIGPTTGCAAAVSGEPLASHIALLQHSPEFCKIKKKLQIFGELVLGCIKMKFCKKIYIRQHFSSSARFAYFCAAAISKV